MMISCKMPATRMVAGFAAAAFAVLVWASAAPAADAIFPTGSRVGLVPPPGMTPSRNFVGFEDAQEQAAILLAAFPAEAFSALDKSMVPESLASRASTNANRWRSPEPPAFC